MHFYTSYAEYLLNLIYSQIIGNHALPSAKVQKCMPVPKRGVDKIGYIYIIDLSLSNRRTTICVKCAFNISKEVL
jgi:hypothetical protein